MNRKTFLLLVSLGVLWVSLILVTVTQQGLVKLADMVLGETHVGVGLEYEVHRLGVSGRFLLIARFEELDGDRPREQVLDLGVR